MVSVPSGSASPVADPELLTKVLGHTDRQTNKHDPANVNFDRYRSKSSFKERTTSILLHYDFGLGQNGFKLAGVVNFKQTVVCGIVSVIVMRQLTSYLVDLCIAIGTYNGYDLECDVTV